MKDCYLILPIRGKTLTTTLEESVFKPLDFSVFYLVTPMTVVLRVVPARTPIISGCQLNFVADHNSEHADFFTHFTAHYPSTSHKFWGKTTTGGVPKADQVFNLHRSPLVHSSCELLIIKINEVHQP